MIELDKISYYSIQTNNLNNIDYHIVKNAVNFVVGASGSGKSSLVFNTINAISQHEYKTMIGEQDNEITYRIESFKNILMSVPLEQLNYNTNPRSTIATYYNVDKSFRTFYSQEFLKDSKFFSFNVYSSMCKACKGLGYILIPDEAAIIDYDATISEQPFYPWRGSYKEYYKQLMINTAISNKIPTTVPFRCLTLEHKNFLLYGKGDEKYRIEFSLNGRKKVKTDKYIGIVNRLEAQIKDNDAEGIRYSQQTVCPICNGTRFSKEVNKLKIQGKSIGEIYLLTMTELKEWLLECIGNDSIGKKVLKDVLNFSNKLLQVKLGYLNLNRSIPSLSGGEFQRLRLSQLLESELSNILYILDEPLSSLHASEKEAITNEIIKLKKENTLLIIEHDEEFLKKSDYVTALGPSGGKFGGNIITINDYFAKSNQKKNINYSEFNKFINMKSDFRVNNVKCFDISIPLNQCIGICGVSGSGKSTFAKEILPKLLSNYKYISQKPIRGNSYSIIATYTNVFDRIKQLFSEKNNCPKSMFSFYHNSEGSCKTCNGKGEIDVSDFKYQYSYICPECEGSKYSKKILTYYYNGLNIPQVLALDISEAVDFFRDDNELNKLFNNAVSVGLGYLKLNQSIDSLSGGENQRIKLLKHLNFKDNNKIIALDEPFRGLTNDDVYNIMRVLWKYCREGNTIIVIEHNVYALELCSYLVEFGLGSGELGGEIIYSGPRSEIHSSRTSIIKEYISNV